MKYIQIRPGINILKSEVIGVEKIDDMSCKILTSVGAYDSVYPSWRIIMLLEESDIEERLMPTPDRVNLWGHQHFAG